MKAKKRTFHCPVPEPLPEWARRYPSLDSGLMPGLYHLKRRGPCFTTLCGLISHGWRRWPGLGWSRPDLDESCGRCMRIATTHILGGRYVSA